MFTYFFVLVSVEKLKLELSTEFRKAKSCSCDRMLLLHFGKSDCTRNQWRDNNGMWWNYDSGTSSVTVVDVKQMNAWLFPVSLSVITNVCLKVFGKNVQPPWWGTMRTYPMSLWLRLFDPVTSPSLMAVGLNLREHSHWIDYCECSLPHPSTAWLEEVCFDTARYSVNARAPRTWQRDGIPPSSPAVATVLC